jgi:hypothetical protein
MRSWRIVSVAHTQLFADFCVYGILIFFNIFPVFATHLQHAYFSHKPFLQPFLFPILINAARLGSINADVGLKGRA